MYSKPVKSSAITSKTTTKTRKPRPPPSLATSPFTIETGTGSYWEYVVRTIIRNSAAVYPREKTINITDMEQWIYFYHIQIMHADLLYIRNWQERNHDKPSLHQLPSRAVKYFYDQIVEYKWGDDEKRTVDSHYMKCDECNRVFNTSVNNVRNHALRNNASTSSGSGSSFFENAVQTAIRNLPAFRPIQTANNRITDLEQIVYYYHLKMTHIDLLWVQNWNQENLNGFLSIFQLPSRTVRNFSNVDVPHSYDNYQLSCGECDRQFNDNVNVIGSHDTKRHCIFKPFYDQKHVRLFERRDRAPPNDEIRLEDEQRNHNDNFPLILLTTKELEMRRNQSFQSTYQSGPLRYYQSTTSTTRNCLQDPQMQLFYDSLQT